MIVFIPIKEKSQRVRNKNFRNFNNKPLWKHSIEKLKDFNVFIDTDSELIINECSDYNFVTPFKREESLLGHDISVVDLIKSFVKRFSFNDQVICQTHVTSPFLNIEHINFANKILCSNKYDSILTVNKFQNRFWSLKNEILSPLNHNPSLLQQTQDLTPIYEENSYFYMFFASVLENDNRIGHNPFIYEIDFPFNIDIDNEKDFEIAELILKTQLNENY
tara:strand:- start:10873 stop:11532 length:660 start_codon:yes stop_codon:yes gene_type:complete